MSWGPAGLRRVHPQPGPDTAAAAGPVALKEHLAATEFDMDQFTSPVLIVHGGQDRLVPSSHSTWLTRHSPPIDLWLRPDDGYPRGSPQTSGLRYLRQLYQRQVLRLRRD